MKPTFILCVALACGLLQNAWAEKADRNKPMHIESDSMRYEDSQQLTVFTGKVVATKGTIVIRGAKVEVRQDPEGNQHGTVTGTPKERAFFRQKREGVDEFIEGEAETLIYNGKTDTVRFETNAVMRRFRGSTLADEVTGAIINYENTTEKFAVDGSAAGTTPGGRVRAVLTPKPENSPAKTP
jgi:lipopolysaccharide export system protein LptA